MFHICVIRLAVLNAFPEREMSICNECVYGNNIGIFSLYATVFNIYLIF